MLGLLAAQIGKQQRTEDVTLLLQVLPELTQQAPPVMQAIVQRLAAKPESALARQIADVTGGKAEELMRGVVEDALGIAGDNKQPAEARVAAVERLRLGKLMELSSLLTELLAPSQPAELQAAALATLASFDAPAVGPLIVESYAGLSPRLRTQAADLLCSRPAWVAALLEAVEKNVIVARDLEPGRLKLLAENPDETLRNRAAAILKQNQLGQRGEVVAAYKSALTLPGDAVRGKEAFIKVCAACHKVQGLGHEIGPNLAAMRSRGPEAILLNVLDPNREVNPQYLSYLVQLTDGRTLSGMIAGETATSLMLIRADNLTDTILRIDIQRLKSTGQSLMPEGLEKQIDPQKLADLLEYLKSVE